jgi:hypothetical protein
MLPMKSSRTPRGPFCVPESVTNESAGNTLKQGITCTYEQWRRGESNPKDNPQNKPIRHKTPLSLSERGHQWTPGYAEGHRKTKNSCKVRTNSAPTRAFARGGVDPVQYILGARLRTRGSVLSPIPLRYHQHPLAPPRETRMAFSGSTGPGETRSPTATESSCVGFAARRPRIHRTHHLAVATSEPATDNTRTTTPATMRAVQTCQPSNSHLGMANASAVNAAVASAE